ncbi:MAG: 4-hydroxythreonine-4-phosphate dehydrogenase PdxA [bacterium]
MKPLALTPGEPAGIGPDLAIMLAQQARSHPVVAIADPQLLQQRALKLGLPLQLVDPDSSHANQPGYLALHELSAPAPDVCGQTNVSNARYVLKSLDIAIEGCVTDHFSAMVTGPVHKGIINDAGITFTGHTEYIAAKTGGQPVMMLACPGLRVALVTTHLPLRDVADRIDRELLTAVTLTLHQSLKEQFRVDHPRILVCGLNPHAGEDGHLGTEEQTVITPVLESLQQQGLNLVGPMPADTLFNPPSIAKADAVLAMYHDQGLPVLKHMGFGEAVNITLGLPIIRTSVDHGTAFDLAGTGKANAASLLAALNQAAEMAWSTD